MSYRYTNVLKTQRITKDVYIIEVEWFHRPPPGTFFMVHVIGVEAIPLSVFDYTWGRLKFLVKIRGPTTRMLMKEKIVGLMGPLGNSPPKPKGEVIYLAGGIGLAPLYYMKKIWGGELIVGFRSRTDVLPFGDVVYTEDGSFGRKGLVTDHLKFLDINDVEVYACGPPPMLSKLSEMGVRGWGSTERYVRCAMGFCGKCMIKDKLLCKDTWLPLSYFRYLSK